MAVNNQILVLHNISSVASHRLILSLLTTPAVIYFAVVPPMNKMIKRMRRGEEVDPLGKTCPHCLSQIPLKATKCKFCTSAVK